MAWWPWAQWGVRSSSQSLPSTAPAPLPATTSMGWLPSASRPWPCSSLVSSGTTTPGTWWPSATSVAPRTSLLLPPSSSLAPSWAGRPWHPSPGRSSRCCVGKLTSVPSASLSSHPPWTSFRLSMGPTCWPSSPVETSQQTSPSSGTR